MIAVAETFSGPSDGVALLALACCFGIATGIFVCNGKDRLKKWGQSSKRGLPSANKAPKHAANKQHHHRSESTLSSADTPVSAACAKQPKFSALRIEVAEDGFEVETWDASPPRLWTLEPRACGQTRDTPPLRTFTSRASTQKPKHIKDSSRLRLGSEGQLPPVPCDLLAGRHLQVPDGQVDKHGAGSTERLHRVSNLQGPDSRHGPSSNSLTRSGESFGITELSENKAPRHHSASNVTVDINQCPAGSSRHQTSPNNAKLSRTLQDTRALAPDVDARAMQERGRGARTKSEHTDLRSESSDPSSSPSAALRQKEAVRRLQKLYSQRTDGFEVLGTRYKKVWGITRHDL